MMIDILNHLKTEERAELLDSLGNDLQAGEIEFPKIQPHFQSFWTELHFRIRVLCLTTSSTNELMWAHYGDSHKGVVIELACDPENDSPWLTALKVKYSDTPPTAATVKDFVDLITGNHHSLSFEKLYQPFILTKGTGWSYEEEWRAFTYAKDDSVFNDWKIIPPEVKAVYLGARIEASQCERILEILNDQFPNTKAFKTSLSPSDRQLHFQPV